MTGIFVFDPLLPWSVIWALAGFAALGVILAATRGLAGWVLRAIASLVVVAALTQPSYQVEDRAPLSDIVLMIVDESASQRLASRFEDTEVAADALQSRLERRPNT